MRGKRHLRTLVAAAAAAVVLLAAPAAEAIPWDQPGAIPPEQTPPASQPDPDCSQSYANDAPAGGPALHFGIGPRQAGDAGSSQTPVVRGDPGKRDDALLALKGNGPMSVRLNRLFMSEGRAGIERFRKLARHYTRLGFDVEIQVRYHPSEAQNGDIGAWLDYVRRVVRAFGPIRGVKRLQITNEVNLTFSPNTSDGYYENAVEALARGVPAAKREARRLGYDRLRTGFNYAWRFGAADADFWREVGAAGGEPLRRATDWVGIDAYPGTLVPTTLADPGDALIEGVAQVRECFMPLAGLGKRMPIHLEELGYATGTTPSHSETAQKRALTGFVKALNRYRGAYGITAVNWFGLRDNNSAGTALFSQLGLLRDDYSPKPAFEAYRKLIRRYR